MITFTSLFLGLVFGAQTVVLDVDPRVASVGVRLDGAVVARLDGPPWEHVVDLGDALEPHRLEAIAYDQEGLEIDRTEQWLNLPQPPADARLLLETDASGRVSSAGLRWESLAGRQPLAVEVSFDGQPLEIDDPRSFALPAHDPDALHFLRAELRFGENVVSVVEATLGGTYGSEVSTELTAVPVVTNRPRRLERAGALDGTFLGPDGALPVVGVEHGKGAIVVVLDRAADAGLRAVIDDVRALSAYSFAERLDALHSWTDLGPERSLRVVWPVTRSQEGVGTQYDLFTSSLDFSTDRGGLYFLLHWAERPPHLGDGPQRLADAVAIAGLEAVAPRRARAVVLVTGAEPEDESVHDPRQVRHFLSRLRVPLVVWSVDGKPGRALRERWGDVTDVSSSIRFQRATAELIEVLERQWTAWIDGAYLPTEIRLAPGTRGMKLVE